MNTNTWTPRLLSRRALTSFLLCGACWWGAACGHTQAFAPVDMGTVMHAVETYGKGHAPAAAKAEPAAGAGATDSKDPAQGSSSYQAHVAIVLSEENFDQLEKEAQKWRTSKATVEGGHWRLSQLYDGVSNPPLKENSTDADWETHFASLAKWVAKYPASATARIATAEAYARI